MVRQTLDSWSPQLVARWKSVRYSRQCALASLTSFTFSGDDLVTVSYEEPARDLLPAPVAGGKKFAAGA